MPPIDEGSRIMRVCRLGVKFLKTLQSTSFIEKACEFWKSLDQLPMLTNAYATLAILHTFMGNYASTLFCSKKAQAYEIALKSTATGDAQRL
jgi:hypothetical protein